jgi:hypothetical protein
MATNNTPKVTPPAESSVPVNSRDGPFSGCVPQAITAAKVMDASKAATVWTGLYTAAGVASAQEDVKKSLRCAVYTYLAVNGASPSGAYPGTITSGKGATLSAAAIPEFCGRYSIRQFARAGAAEALQFFYATDVLTTNAVMRAKCELLEVPAESAVALVDFLDLAAALRPADRDVQKAIRNFSIERARRGRGGKNMEEMRGDHYDATLTAQGPAVPLAREASGW